MSPILIASFVGGYFLLLLLISFITGRNADNKTFFLGNRTSPWFVVAFGMIGTSLSGVTFISVPGWVASSQFSYMQMVMGYLVGYLVIGTVLMPLYYRLNLTSIYTYLEQRLGFWSYKTGAFYFLLSRTIGAAFRLYLVALVFQIGIFDPLELEVNFAFTVILTILLIWLYTFRSGIKTIIWTDTLQTLFMLLAVTTTLVVIAQRFELGPMGLIDRIADSEYSRIFYFDDVNDSKFFLKQFLSGAFIAIVMTGLDQDMMQKNLSCRTVGDAQKNMFWFSIVLVFVNMLFLSLGAALYLFAQDQGLALPEKGDQLFPLIAINGYLGPVVAIFFVLGLIAAAYSSADSALTALTTSFCVDIINVRRFSDQQQIRVRQFVHVGFSTLLVAVILAVGEENASVIEKLFKVAGYTYGPLLGLFAFGMLTKLRVRDLAVLPVCLASPILCFFLSTYSEVWFNGYQIGFEILIINGAVTFLGLLGVSNGKVPPPLPEKA